MTTQPQPEALRQRLLDHAACHEAEHTLMGEDEQRQWAADLREAESLIGRLHAECEALRATQSDTLLRLLCDLRFALGDNGARMQHDLVEYARGLRAEAERGRWLVDWLEQTGLILAQFCQPAVGTRAEDWFVFWRPLCADGTSIPEGYAKTPEGAIDAARAAKEQSK